MTSLAVHVKRRHAEADSIPRQPYANKLLYEHLFLQTAAQAQELCGLTRREDGLSLTTRIARDTRAISLGFPFTASPDVQKGLLISDISHLLRITQNLTSFVCKAPQLSILPQPVLQRLFEWHTGTLKILHGYATGFSSGAETLPFFCGLERIEQLTTGPTWLPSHAPSCEAVIERLLETSKGKVFRRLRSLYTPMVANHNVLFDVLIRCELPELRHLRVSSWDRKSLECFLDIHGSKLTHLEIKYSWTEETLANKHIHARPPKSAPPILLRLISLCPNLTDLTLHDGHSFGLLVQAETGWTHPHLRTIRMGCSASDGPWVFPESMAEPASWCLTTQRTVQCTTEILGKGDWQRILPSLERFVVWPPTRPIVPDEDGLNGEVRDESLQEMAGREIVDRWNTILEGQKVRVDIQDLAVRAPRAY